MNNFDVLLECGVKKTIALILLGLLLVFPTDLVAQELSETESTVPVIQDVDGLRLQLVQRTQDPTSGEVQFDLIVYPKITSDRVQLTWSVNGASELLSAEKQVLNLVAGNYQVISAVVKPRQLGVTDLLARVEGFTAGGVYLATAKKTFGSFATGEVFPLTGEYRFAQIVGGIRTLAIAFIVLILIYWIVSFARQKLRAWLDSR
ncbi:MAG: hypothetical protein JNK26_03080 [Candidatus Doudnabacteria bacterium]|nr:hypothetical protein [Candidatus Doudnabacteria bacterium]